VRAGAERGHAGAVAAGALSQGAAAARAAARWAERAASSGERERRERR
jgi:hypothetical protein